MYSGIIEFGIWELLVVLGAVELVLIDNGVDIGIRKCDIKVGVRIVELEYFEILVGIEGIAGISKLVFCNKVELGISDLV